MAEPTEQQMLVKLLKEQNEMLGRVLEMITPVAEFFNALRVVARFAAWIVGIVGTCYGAWQGVKSFILMKQ